jgi:hypothetical protein
MDKMHDKITTSKIDELTASECAYKSSIHPDFGILGAPGLMEYLRPGDTVIVAELSRTFFYHLTSRNVRAVIRGNDAPLIHVLTHPFRQNEPFGEVFWGLKP